MATKKQRRMAAKLYVAAWLHHDDGELTANFKTELNEISNGILRRLHWPYDHIPSTADILRALTHPSPQTTQEGR